MRSQKGHKEETKTAGKVYALMNQTLLTDMRSLIFLVSKMHLPKMTYDKLPKETYGIRST